MNTNSHPCLFAFLKQCFVCLFVFFEKKNCCILMFMLSCPLFICFISALAEWMDILMFTCIMEGNGLQNVN